MLIVLLESQMLELNLLFSLRRLQWVFEVDNATREVGI